MKFSQGTPQQQAAMLDYRAKAKQNYTEQIPVSISFAAEVELLEALIREHWSRQEAATLMAWLVDASWDYYAPYDFIKDWTLNAIKAMKDGMSYAEAEAGGLFNLENSLFPIDNLNENQKRRHELMAFDDEQQTGPPVKFKDRVKAMQRLGAKGTFGGNN